MQTGRIKSTFLVLEHRRVLSRSCQLGYSRSTFSRSKCR